MSQTTGSRTDDGSGPTMPPPHPDLLPGVLVGHDTDLGGPTGVTVILFPEGCTGGVDVRGAAPGTRETDLLDPVNTIDVVDAIVLAGGSAYGLASADGVMTWLEGQGRGVPVGPVRVPIVPAAVIFDLLVGDPTVRPDAESGARACAAAVPLAHAAQGSVGVGTGATIGKLLGPDRVMRGGLGIASIRAHGVTMAAVVAVNAVGDVVDPSTGVLLAGARGAPDGTAPVGALGAWLAGATDGRSAPDVPPGSATTIGVVVTDVALSKAQARRLAQVSHDGLALTIRPVHTPMDGDTMFAVGTGTAGAPQPAPDMTVLSMLATEVTARAVLSAIQRADALVLPDGVIPAWRDHQPGGGD